MSLDSLLRAVSNFTGTLSPALVLTIFSITTIGEFGFSIPYLLETIWLLTGYHLANGTLSVFEFSLIFLSAEAGRLTGAVALYHVSHLGIRPLMRVYRRFFGTAVYQAEPQPEPRPPQEEAGRRKIWTPFRLMRRINYLSPFSVATGRLIWLRIPLTLTLSVKRDWKTLILAVLISSGVWDSTYIILGIAGRNVAPRPTQMVLYSLLGLTLLYGATALVRFLRRRPRPA